MKSDRAVIKKEKMKSNNAELNRMNDETVELKGSQNETIYNRCTQMKLRGNSRGQIA